MSEHDLRAITLGYYSSVDAGDGEAVLAWFTEDATYWRPGYPAMTGRNSLAAFYGGERVIESGAHSVEEVLVDADRVAVRGIFRGRLKDGSETVVGFADFLRYGPAGRVLERRTYFDAPAD